MSRAGNEDLKRRVRDANNLLDIVQSAVGKLTRAGRNYKACCPFHNEKTPSFNVNVEGQYFKCFGCGKSGDVFSFIMLHERCEFPEALRILADRAGIQVEIDQKSVETYKKETDWKSYLYKLNEAASRFFREQLAGAAGAKAREYVEKRGLAREICERFDLGYAPAGGSPLLAYLQKLKAPMKAILAAGLATQRDDGSVKDFFFDRLMFPIRDIQGRVIAFGGRILGDGEPKYLNTRETPLFSKTKTVYGIDAAKDAIVKARTAVLVEGYTDVMMCHQFGINNVVACLGTAITVEHVRQLRRVADRLVMLTDSDAAGAKASERSLGVLFQEQVPATIARLPGADKDPCDFLLAKGASGKTEFEAALQNSVDLFSYKFERVRLSHDLASPMGLRNAAAELMDLVSLIPDTLLKNRYRNEVLQRLSLSSRWNDISPEDLKFTPAPTPAAIPEKEPEPGADLGVVPAPGDDLARAERELLRFLFHAPAWLEPAVTHVDLSGLVTGPERLIGLALLDALGEGRLPPDPAELVDQNSGSIVAREVLNWLQSQTEGGIVALSDSAMALAIELAETPPAGTKLEAGLRLDMVVRPLQKATLQRKYDQAMRQWTQAKLSGGHQAETDAYKEVMTLRKAISALKTRPLN